MGLDRPIDAAVSATLKHSRSPDITVSLSTDGVKIRVLQGRVCTYLATVVEDLRRHRELPYDGTTVMGQAPSIVQRLINLANLADGQDVVELPGLWLRLSEGADMWLEATKVAARFPKPLRDHIGPITSDTTQQFVSKWDEVFKAEQILLAMINTANGPMGVSEVWGVHAELTRETNGALKVSLTSDLQALAGVSAARIARCVQCRKFLWMSRLRAEPFCSPSPACRQARWRERNPEMYQKAQAENERKRAERERRAQRRPG
jgi:hypothetical protein